MAYGDFDGSLPEQGGKPAFSEAIRAEGARIELPDAAYVRDAAMHRDGVDLVLDGPDGSITVEGYFAAAVPPDLAAPDGSVLTPALVGSFVRSAPVYAQAQSHNDASPVGEVSEVSGEASVLRPDGSTAPIVQGTKIYQGDVIETGDTGAVNVQFIDDTSFAVSADARLAIDEYVYDPATQSGAQGFSVLKGLFVFTSGLIGRDDPDDVRIETPTGSIGIRGTIIAGNATSGEITLIEGAIVVRDLSGNEVSLSAQFETAQIVPGDGVHNLGPIRAAEVLSRFESLSVVAPTLFSSIDETAAMPDEQAPGAADSAPVPGDSGGDATGAADRDGDSRVDGSAGTETKPGEAASPAEALPEDGAGLAPLSSPVGDVRGMLGLDPFGSHSGLEPLAPHSAGAPLDYSASLSLQPLPSSSLSSPASAPLPAAPAKDPGLIVPAGESALPPAPLPSSPVTSAPPPVTPPAPADDLPLHIRSSLNAADYNIAPDVYFMAAEGQAWSYDFSREFLNTEPGDSLTYHLSTATQSALTGIFGAEGALWSFSVSTGLLSFSQGAVVTGNQSFNIEIKAVDLAGQSNAGGYKAYAFTVYDGPQALSGIIMSDGGVYAGGPSNDTEIIGSDPLFSSGNILFTGGGNDTVYVDMGNNNIINLGGGNNTANITAGTGNTVIGGSEKDVYQASAAQNRFFGMGGDDKAVLNLSNTGLIAGFNSPGNSGIRIDLGGGGFKAGAQMAGNATLQGNGFNYLHGGDSSGYGDTLFLQGNGSLNFGAIDDNYIRGVERIDLRGATATVSLSYQDVIEMTDYKNTLIFRANGGDTLNFSGFGPSFVKVGDNISLDDNYDGSGPAAFDVYSDGTVTLLIEDSGASVTGISAL